MCIRDSCDSIVMIRSPVLAKYQDGIFFHAAARDGVWNAFVEAARCVAHRRSAVSLGRSEANERRKGSRLRYRSLAPTGAFA